MVCLYDTNVWVALSFASHPHHGPAARHFRNRDSVSPAAFCRATQLSFLRLVTTPVIHQTYGAATITNAEAWTTLFRLLALPQVLCLDEPSGLEALWHPLASLDSPSPKVWMDSYLASFAIGHQLELVSLDRDFEAYQKAGLQFHLLP